MGDDEQCSARVLEADVHAAGGVVKDPVGRDAFGEPLGFPFGIAPLDTEQQQNAGANFTDGDAIDHDGGMRDALQQSNHQQPCTPDTGLLL